MVGLATGFRAPCVSSMCLGEHRNEGESPEKRTGKGKHFSQRDAEMARKGNESASAQSRPLGH